MINWDILEMAVLLGALGAAIGVALMHHDCPVHMSDWEAKKLSRHLAIRINGSYGSKKKAN
jgi:hypothetical protein